MDKLIYNALCKYYHVLETTGYMNYSHAVKLLVLIFFRDFVYHDFRGLLTREDYRTIERALYCLFGSTCLIPYPDYLKMGKLYLGEITEMAQRIKTIEDTNVLKAIDSEAINSDEQSDVIILAE